MGESYLSIWSEHFFQEESALEHTIGDLRLATKNHGDEVWLSAHHSPNERVPSGENSGWERWALGKPSPSIDLSPAFPDRSVVVKPESPFRLLPDVQARIYVRVPIWVTVKLSGKKGVQLSQMPSAILSLTWFGSPMEGELCYWLSSSAKREVIPDPNRSHLAICPVQLKNNSGEDLMVEKLCLRVQWLSLYEDQAQLWSNETKVFYDGAAEGSRVSVSNGPPREAGQATLKSPPRESAKKNFNIRTFFSLGKDI